MTATRNKQFIYISHWPQTAEKFCQSIGNYDQIQTKFKLRLVRWPIELNHYAIFNRFHLPWIPFFGKWPILTIQHENWPWCPAKDSIDVKLMRKVKKKRERGRKEKQSHISSFLHHQNLNIEQKSTKNEYNILTKLVYSKKL